ncbi:YciI family protein [Jannaschia rubra]|uniref:YciI-like protein n=2 Tax=Jannaschia rubra TaxID=282197 RepID=A0A0M6XUK5_9RHOB|nr:YciI family protein [Jannaschia rubra]CTQ33614.1 YciI-like protein [Jannaschia rubra]SFG04945.1 hypothetical protein SAMN04488517_102443 [Jannaschia rubra]
MLHALICTDKPNHLHVRKANRDAHLARVKADERIVQAGPLLDATGEMCGSLIVFDTDSRAHVEAFVAADPYATAGLFAEVRIVTWNRVLSR